MPLTVMTGKIRSSFRFPTMKSVKTGSENVGVGAHDDPNGANTVGSSPAIEGAPIISNEKPDFSNVNIEPLFEDYVDFETFQKSDFRAVKVIACEAVLNKEAHDIHS